MATFTLTASSLSGRVPGLGTPGIPSAAFQVTAFQPNAFQTIWALFPAAVAAPRPVIGSPAITQPNTLVATSLALPPPQLSTTVALGRNYLAASALTLSPPVMGTIGLSGLHQNFTAAILSPLPPQLDTPLFSPAVYIPPPPQGILPVQSGYVLHNQDDFAVALANLFPTGAAWSRDDDDSVFMQFIFGLAGPWADVAVAADLLLEIESDPGKATLMLPDWEKSFGLPDPCVAEPLTFADRRTALIQRMTLLGEADRNFLISQAAKIGYGISRIIEFSPYMCGISMCGDTRILNAQWDPNRYRWELGVPRWYWLVRVGAERLVYFHCASGICGVNRLLDFGFASDLECLLRRIKPAHTEVIFDYSAINLMTLPPAYMTTPPPALGKPAISAH
jgi:uncharacterized protein YmfQ (DUF2313 family)